MTRFVSQGVTDLGLPRYNDIMFEPEEELSVTHEKLRKEFSDALRKPSISDSLLKQHFFMNEAHLPQAALLHDADALNSDRAAVLRDGDALKAGSVISEDVLNAKLAEKSRKKEKKRRPKIQFEHLPCCIENVQLQDNLAAAEEHISVQDQKLKDMKKRSEEMLGHLSAEVKSLKARMTNSSSPESDQTFSLRVQLEMAISRARVETEDFQQQLEAKKRRIFELEAKIVQAEAEARESQTKLSESWKSHEQEVSKLQRQLAEERAAHRLEVQQVSAELDVARKVAKEQPMRASDEMLANAHQDILKLEQTVRELEVLCPNRREEQEINAQRDLVDACAKLHGPASTLVTLFGQPPLPSLSAKSIGDPSLHVQWLGVLGKSMGVIFQQLATRVNSQ